MATGSPHYFHVGIDVGSVDEGPDLVHEDEFELLRVRHGVDFPIEFGDPVAEGYGGGYE